MHTLYALCRSNWVDNGLSVTSKEFFISFASETTRDSKPSKSSAIFTFTLKLLSFLEFSRYSSLSGKKIRGKVTKNLASD